VIRLPASKAVLDTIGASKDTIASGFSSSKIQIRTAISTVSEKLWEPERTASERRRTQQQLDLTTRTAFLACPTPYRSVFHVAISTAINQSIKTAPVWQDPLKLFFLGAASISQPLQQNQDSRGLEPCASDWAKYFRNIEAGRRDSTRPLHARGSGPAFSPCPQEGAGLPPSPGLARLIPAASFAPGLPIQPNPHRRPFIPRPAAYPESASHFPAPVDPVIIDRRTYIGETSSLDVAIDVAIRCRRKARLAEAARIRAGRAASDETKQNRTEMD
jgi:hypothetical protein